jgi:hypothetical protein
MPGGKVHGGGGHGRHSREQRRKLVHQVRAQEGIERQQAKRERYFDRKFEGLAEHFDNSIKPVAQKALANIQSAMKPSAHKKTLIRQQAIIRLLAVDAWHHGEAVRKAKELHIEGHLDPEKFHILEREQREALWKEILSKKVVGGTVLIPRKPAELKEEIEKWKGRVKHMAEGRYI